MTAMRNGAWILYEDRRAPDSSRYPFHDLILRIILDRSPTPIEMRKLERAVQANPRKGSGNLAKADLEQLSSRGAAVIALVDADKVHKLLPSISPAERRCAVTVTTALRASFPAQLDWVLLRDNLESVLRSLNARGLTGVPNEAFEHAFVDKDLIARDIVLRAATRDANKAARLALCADVRDLAYLADRIAACLPDEE